MTDPPLTRAEAIGGAIALAVFLVLWILAYALS